MKKTLAIIALLLIGNTLSFAQSDNCVTATILTLPGGSECINGTTTGATSNNLLYGGCNGVSVNEVWYSYVVQGAINTFQVNPGTMQDAEIVVYTVSCPSTGGQLEFCTTAVGGASTNDSWGLAPGTQVWIGVMSTTGSEGTFQLCVTSTDPPPTGGNTCATALPTCAGTTALDMNTTTPSGVFPSCFGAAVNNDAWYTFTVLQSGAFEWSAVPSGVSSGVELDWALYDVTGGCPGTEVDCNYNFDGGANGANGQIPGGTGEFNPPSNLIAGNTYAIVIDFFSNTSTGTMDFTIGNGTAVIAPDVNFTIAPTTITCGASVTVVITDNSIGVPTWDFGDGTSFTGNNPPDHTYTTPGTYAITAIITGTCNDLQTEFVQLFGPLLTVPTSTPETCIGDCDGTASVAPSGGSGTYTYAWTPAGPTGPAQTGLCTGPYSVTVTDNICGTNSVENFNITGPVCVTCTITSMPVTLTNCYTDGGGFLVWDAAGTVNYTDAPTTGTLTITACDGQTVVLNAPFAAGSSAFTFIGVPQGVGNCNFTAVFSADPACTFTEPFMTPPVITFFQSFCTVGGGSVNGDITFDGTYTSGTVTISVFDGTSTIDTNIILPAASPQNWSVSGLDPTANPYTISYYFSDYPTCGGQLVMNCGCSADAGTVTSTITGSGTNNYVLCDGDQIDITTNNDFVDPDDIGPLGTGPFYPFTPALMYVVYSCPPTPGIWPPNDPCYVGLLPVTNTMTDINDINSWANLLPGGPYTDLWYAQTNVYYWDGTTAVWNANCWDVGPAVQVTYLNPIATPAVPDCQNGTLTITLTGGYPEQFGGNFTASNLLPLTANFVNTTTTHGGDIVIDGLQDGDMWSFDIVDGNGCPITVSGGPFVGLPTANAGIDDTICALTYTLGSTPSVGTGTWTGPAGITFGTPNSATSIVTATTAGTYTLTWTEDNGGGCTSADQVDITFTQMSITFSAFDASCFGICDGNAIVIPAGGIVGPGGYTYTWTPAAIAGNVPNASSLCTGTYSLSVSDQSGCSVDTLNWNINAPVSVAFTSVTATDESCAAACDGSIAVVAPSATAFSINGGVYAAPSTFIGLCAGVYTLSAQDASGCQADTVATINAPPPVTLTVTPDTTICTGGTATLTATGGGGAGGFVYLWDTGETTATITPSPAGTQQYCVGVADANGCPAPAQACITVNVNPVLQVVALSDQGICPGDIASISALANGGDGNHTYTWDNGLGVGQLQNVSPAVTTIYTVTASDGCETPDATASVTITVNPLPTIDFTPDTTTGCTPVTVNFTEIGQPAGSQCFWDFGDANAAVACGTVSNTYTAPGCYDVTLTVISDLGCTDQITYPSLICVSPYPTASFTFGPQPTSVLNPTINFTNTSTGADTYDWTFGIGGSLGASTETDPSFTFPFDNPGSYQACLLATSTFGCQDSICNTVVIDEEFLVYVPNAFTPDADNLNETFMPVVIGADPLQYEFLIFDRWGELIYESQILGQGWDGTYKGLLVKQDVYVWRLRVVNNMNIEKHEYKGHVTILK